MLLEVLGEIGDQLHRVRAEVMFHPFDVLALGLVGQAEQ